MDLVEAQNLLDCKSLLQLSVTSRGSVPPSSRHAAMKSLMAALKVERMIDRRWHTKFAYDRRMMLGTLAAIGSNTLSIERARHDAANEVRRSVDRYVSQMEMEWWGLERRTTQGVLDIERHVAAGEL
jgi:hypothetical protein